MEVALQAEERKREKMHERKKKRTRTYPKNLDMQMHGCHKSTKSPSREMPKLGFSQWGSTKEEEDTRGYITVQAREENLQCVKNLRISQGQIDLFVNLTN